MPATATVPAIQAAFARYKQHIGEYPYSLRLCAAHYGTHQTTIRVQGALYPAVKLPDDVHLCLVCTFGEEPKPPTEEEEQETPEATPEEEPTPPAEPVTPAEHAAASTQG